MSIVDDRMHVGGEQTHDELLWRTADPVPIVTGSAFRSPSSPATSGWGARRSSEVLVDAGTGDQLWQARIDLIVSSGLSGDAARKSREDAERTRHEAMFEELCDLCRDELRTVLDRSVETLSEWGLSARVTETLRDEPVRVPRSFDLTLWIDRFGDRGPGKLTITATERCDFVRIKLSVGPSRLFGDVSEHVGTTIASDLSDQMVGGLVATLVEQIFNS
jgi:hypothetical protein